jgi:MscS family membrane protein
MEWLYKIIGEVPKSFGWLIHIAFIVAFGVIGYFAKKIIYSRLKKHSDKSSFHWDSALVGASSTAASCAIWLTVIWFSIEVAKAEFKHAATTLHPVQLGIELLSIILVTWVLYNFVRIYEERLLATVGDKQDEATRIDIVSKLLRVAFFGITALIVLQFLGISVTGLVAFGSAGALVVGLAGKEILANFFGGVMIYFDRPFKVGDWIMSPDREIEGTVEHIGLRLTRIRTFDKRPLYLPNSTFSSIALVNPSRMTNRRIKETIGIRYCDSAQMRSIVKAVREMLDDHPDIDQRRYKMVHFLEFGPSSLDFQIYTFTKTTNWELYRDVQQDVFLKIIDIIHAHGADIAFPTRTLHIEKDTPQLS